MRWTAGAVDRLRELAPAGIGIDGIAMKLGRSRFAVQKKAEKLGIRIARRRAHPEPPKGDWYWKAIIGPMRKRVRADVERIMSGDRA